MSGRSGDYKKKYTLCWECDKCEGDCCWSKDFIPIDGWEAEDDSRYDSKGDYLVRYIVWSCPEFEKKKPSKTVNYEGAEKIAIEVGQLLAKEYKSAYKHFILNPNVETRSALDYARSGIMDGLLQYMDMDLEGFIRRLEREVRHDLGRRKRRR